MQTRIMVLIFVAVITTDVSASRACEVEKAITEFMSRFCDNIEVAVEKLTLISDTGLDYSVIRPKIMPDDLDVDAAVKGCHIIDRDYGFTLRETENGYKVVTYAAVYDHPDSAPWRQEVIS